MIRSLLLVGTVATSYGFSFSIPAIPAIPAIPGLPALPVFNAKPPCPPPPKGDWAYDKYKLDTTNMPPETCVGYFIRPDQTGDLAKQYSIWVQDPKNKKLRFDIGKPGEKEFLQLYLSANSSFVVVTPGDNKDNLYCMNGGTNFDAVFDAYLYPYVRYLSDGVWKGKQVRYFAGSSPDAFTKTNIPNVLFIGMNYEYYGMAVLTNNGYWYYDYNVTMGPVDQTWFVPPEICNNA